MSSSEPRFLVFIPSGKVQPPDDPDETEPAEAQIVFQSIRALSRAGPPPNSPQSEAVETGRVCNMQYAIFMHAARSIPSIHLTDHGSMLWPYRVLWPWMQNWVRFVEVVTCEFHTNPHSCIQVLNNAPTPDHHHSSKYILVDTQYREHVAPLACSTQYGKDFGDKNVGGEVQRQATCPFMSTGASIPKVVSTSESANFCRSSRRI
ncbi:hypothetical protein I7I51_02270 [Histoplasma capsulatum]|uniref:Uncharacterized protein n=1 Tax=Ajellomyces capsulatus TaxID=5037 RepID=A0A8A1MCT8_AJECA|nr:predicted protein [Histoplasma mississippiense (nom. inval.)]EDN09703.1 predicted protein [Histoplasma mississippiense (nom. inval.)]QSS62533.1 hypothetical protein I7I51_02270 [Histoplasma capsulatum]